MLRYAAIDIGSNAIRLLIADISKSKDGYKYKKNTLIRVPLRLGDDAFLNQIISAKKTTDLVNTMLAFKKLMDVYGVTEYLACATSAMREAKNGNDIVKLIKKQADINLEIIAGQREADIIYANHVEKDLDQNKTYLYIDVGGGSTELSVFVKGSLTASKSFNIGTIRMLDHQDKQETWDEMKAWVQENTDHYKKLAGIGTGGNINKLFRMADEKDSAPLSIQKLSSIYKKLSDFSLKDRIEILGLNPDRADVIIPACEIYLTLMKWAEIDEIYVPKVGMADGLIKVLIEENLEKTKV
ncbi:exopolyphosphatase [Pedobacter changchengzhani]|uniref:Exopolyphosphatase n=1 Tax=Pedobacter changchengzhani TaxID=2529274 RepID=A0A4R5MHK6_9SPHI|nr:exopolyphosphatase [Pedobacter changchengzhani]TDG35002.1 exopolyphosphatase [Pedobacter changchengzhani]